MDRLPLVVPPFRAEHVIDDLAKTRRGRRLRPRAARPARPPSVGEERLLLGNPPEGRRAGERHLAACEERLRLCRQAQKFEPLAEIFSNGTIVSATLITHHLPPRAARAPCP